MRTISTIILIFAILGRLPSFASPENHAWNTIHLNFVNKNKIDPKTDRAMEKWWETLCSDWGKTMISGGNGLNGSGPFLKFNCEPDSEPGIWSLSAAVGKGSIIFTIQHLGKEVSRLEISGSKYPLALLENEMVSKYITLNLLDQLPVLYRVDQSDEDFSKKILESGQQGKNFIPEKLVIYNLDWLEDFSLWKGEVKGYSTPGTTKKDSYRKTRGNDLESRPLWAHNFKGRGYIATEISKILEPMTTEINKKFEKVSYSDILTPYIDRMAVEAKIGFADLNFGSSKKRIYQPHLIFAYFAGDRYSFKSEGAMIPDTKAKVGDVGVSFSRIHAEFSGGLLHAFVANKIIAGASLHLGVKKLSSMLPVEVFEKEYSLTEFSTGLFNFFGGNLSLTFQNSDYRLLIQGAQSFLLYGSKNIESFRSYVYESRMFMRYVDREFIDTTEANLGIFVSLERNYYGAEGKTENQVLNVTSDSFSTKFLLFGLMAGYIW